MWVEYQRAISLIMLFNLGGTEGRCLVLDPGAGRLEKNSNNSARCSHFRCCLLFLSLLKTKLL